MIRKKKSIISQSIMHFVFIVLALICVLPLILTISVSFTDDAALRTYGYSFIPRVFSLDAYRYLFANSRVIIDAYLVTIFATVVGTLLHVFVVSLYAYAISRSDFRFRKQFTFFMFFTMLFNGGTVSWFLVNNSIGLTNTIWALVLPYAFSAWHCIIMRTFFKTSIPAALIESAKMDGAGEYRTFFRIVLPLSLPGLATIGLFATLLYWNDWWLPLMLMNNSDISNIQFLLYNMMANVQAVANNPGVFVPGVRLPAESIRMAMAVITIGPIVLAYPFFQRHFIEGLTIGAVKE